MCFQETKTLGLPAEVIEALAHYRQLLDERGWDWGDEQLPNFFRWARFSLLGPVFEEFAATGDWAKAIRSVIGRDVPAGIVVVRVDEGGGLRADVGPARPAIAGHGVAIDVVVDSAAESEICLTVPVSANCAWPLEVRRSIPLISTGPIRCSSSCSATRR
jgi:hypothetical protein